MRVNGYAAIEDYALIGDGRTAALVARDGAIDWLCLPNFDSSSVLAAVLDATGGGCFELRPDIPGTASRRYLSGTNVLETTWTTDRGVIRVVDAMTLPGPGPAPMRELARRVEGLSGRVPVIWRCGPRFEYGACVPQPAWRGRVPVATNGSSAVAMPSWDAGTPEWRGGTIVSRFELAEGQSGTVALVSAHTEPLLIPGRGAVEARLSDTIAFWQGWSARLQYDGPWTDAVRRSALTLKAL